MLVRRPLSFSRARRKCPIRDAGCEANQGICKVTYPRVAVVAFGGQRVKVQLHAPSHEGLNTASQSWQLHHNDVHEEAQHPSLGDCSQLVWTYHLVLTQ